MAAPTDSPVLSSALHSALQPLGLHAQSIDIVWHTMLWVCGFMYVLVMAWLIAALVRGSKDEVKEEHKVGLSRAVAAWTALIAFGLFGLTLTSFMTDRSLVRAASDPQLTVRIIAHQWWWQVEYTDPVPGRQLRTANELHLPVNTPVFIELAADDVIHSFWVPNLHGKQDLIPGRTNEIRLQPTKEGYYRGECAEFCGYQHAHMAFDVIVESRQDFQNWQDQQLATANGPSDAKQQEGQNVFLQSACPMCHNIAGTNASATVGPDLSHIGSRRTLAAGALDNTPEHMRRWLEDPQREKPGSHMPKVDLSPDQLDSLVAYLEALK
jgi:cytochrome c oxidase subunit 2